MSDVSVIQLVTRHKQQELEVLLESRKELKGRLAKDSVAIVENQIRMLRLPTLKTLIYLLKGRQFDWI